MYKISRFLQIYNSNTNDDENFYLHSTSSNERVLINNKTYNLLKDKCFQLISRELLSDLVYKNIVVPNLIDEKEIIFDYIKSKEKLTIVIEQDFLLDATFENISKLLEQNIYKELCLLFIIQKKHFFTIKELITKLFIKSKNVNILFLEKLEMNSLGFKINIYKLMNEYKDEKIVYTHYIIHNTNDYKNCNSILSEVNISFIGTTEISKEFKDRLTQPKNINTISTLLSEHNFLKELPITGFIVDFNKLNKFLRNKKIDSQCINCSFFLMCGGYFIDSKVECPSFKNISLWNFNKEKEGNSKVDIVGVSNSLTLKSEVLEFFEEMIFHNVDNNEEYMTILYLNKEYNKGYIYAKSNKLIKAKKTFENADDLVKKIIKGNGFSYNYIQTFIGSTKAYLSYKLKRNKDAIDITLKSINSGVKLNKYISSDIISLHISQMLMNISKVYLFSNNIEKWKENTLKNINYLLNFDLPIEAKDYEINSLKNIPDNLRYFMLLEIINQELTYIVKNNFLKGIELIQKISVKDLTSEINKQIFEWVNLVNICQNNNIEILDYKNRISNFLSSKNEITDLSKLKFFLRYLLRKQNEETYKKLIEL